MFCVMWFSVKSTQPGNRIALVGSAKIIKTLTRAAQHRVIYIYI